MSPLVLIDTSAWISALHGTTPFVQAIDQLLAARRAATNHVIVTELLIGAKTFPDYQEFENDLTVLPHLSLTEEVWSEGGRLGFDLRRRGIAASIPDLIIAACAIVHGCEFLGADHDVELIGRHAPLKRYNPVRGRVA